jgi:hexokinase
MSKKITTMVLAFIVAAAAVVSVVPAAATPTSPGACNMLHVSSTGMDGMFKASQRGLDNMISLIVASEASGCTI